MAVCLLSTESHSTGVLGQLGKAASPTLNRMFVSHRRELRPKTLGGGHALMSQGHLSIHQPSILISANTQEAENEGVEGGRQGGRGRPAVGVSLSAHQNVSWGFGQEFRPVGPTGSPANESRALAPFDPLCSPSRP